MRGDAFQARQSMHDASMTRNTAQDRLEKWHKAKGVLREILKAETLEEAKAMAKVGLL